MRNFHRRETKECQKMQRFSGNRGNEIGKGREVVEEGYAFDEEEVRVMLYNLTKAYEL
ncbi:uncharacterized protein G2W53_021223 [Senna tora]|uniref:Uncharacterized protein n=1 Tax=Senna tora TaxID=362788 RepID=A0A834TSH1_9FABA|nr:uncharacterized protein G2W53_021223 [Senna tora]